MADNSEGKGARCVHVQVDLGLRRDGGVDVLGTGASSHTAADGRACRGPSTVATDAYRDGWDRIFGARKAADMGPN